MNNEEKIIQMLTEMAQTMTELTKRVTNIEVTQENTVIPQIQLLAEGHTIIQKQIRNISVIDQLQDDISILKSAVSFLSNELDSLKKAM